MRLNIKNKRELGSELLEKMSKRLQSESSSHEHELRFQAVRDALRPAEPKPVQTVKKEKGPVTETLTHPGNNTTVAELNKYEEDFRAASERDAEGEITPEEEARRLAEADKETARLAQEAEDKIISPYLKDVAPPLTQAEIDARKNSPMSGKQTLTPTREESAFTLRSKIKPAEDQYTFGPTTAEEFAAQYASKAKAESSEEKTSVEAISNVDFNKLAIALEGISERLGTSSIRSVEELQQALNTPELTEGLNELVPAVEHGKNILEFTGKKILGLFGKPQFNKAKASEYFLKLTNEALDRASKSIDNRPVTNKKNPELSDRIKTLSGERSATVTRAPGKEFKVDTDVKKETDEWNEMVASAKNTSGKHAEMMDKNKAERAEAAEVEKTVDAYIEEGTPVFIKSASGEMNSGGRAKLQTADGRVLVTWKDSETQIAASKYVKSADLVSWQKEGVKAPTTKNYEKPRTMYEAAGEYLSSVQDQLKSGQISTTAQLEAALNQMKDPSFRDLLSSQERFTTKISEAVSDKIPGFFGAKYKFNPDLAAEFVAKLNQNATKTAETFEK